jgi:transcriptional regulator with XRE-family HTH domain
MTIGESIRELRLLKGLTQESLAEKMGIKASMVRAYESGRRNPKPDTIQRFADALGVSAGYLMSGSNFYLDSDDQIRVHSRFDKKIEDLFLDYKNCKLAGDEASAQEIRAQLEENFEELFDFELASYFYPLSTTDKEKAIAYCKKLFEESKKSVSNDNTDDSLTANDTNH